MQKETIHQLVSDKNKELERAALRTAESIIAQIAEGQDRMEEWQKKIVELRKELKELEIKQMSAKDILGEE